MIGVYFVSLGCDKNLCDSGHMLYDLKEAGFLITDDPAGADVIVINSCSFIEDAMQESIDTVIELGEYKSSGSCRALILCGCLGERFTEEVERDLYEVDAIVGTNSWDELCSIINDVLSSKPGGFIVKKKPLTGLPKVRGRLRTDYIPTAYLKIAEGCDKRCSYCVIPYIRGSYRSIPVEELCAEASALASEGVTEISLVAQEVTRYGVDLYGKKSLPLLIENLSQIEGIRWIRLLYCYPEEIEDDLIEVMATNKKVCHYIDMPIQHCDDDILRRMGRKTTGDHIISIVGSLRAAMPDIAIRTTLIAGFPGESEAAHRRMLDFVKELRFDRLGCFAYSREEGTPAADMPEQIDPEIKTQRVEAIMEAQRGVVFDINERLRGSVLTCFVEGRIDDGVYAARSHRDAPDVDSKVFIECEDELISGELYDVRITAADGYDLIGSVDIGAQ